MGKMLLRLAALLCLSVQAEEAPPLKVMFGQSRPPYVMAKGNDGISVELTREIFQRMGEPFLPLSGSNKRMEIELQQGRIDVAVEVQPSDPQLFYSAPFIAYRNYLITRRRQAIPFSGHWSDLRGVAVCAWQNASENLGTDFAEASKGFASYTEHSSQRAQVEAWLLGRCDAIIIDNLLLKWQWRQLQELNPRVFGTSDHDVVQVPLPEGHELWWHVGFRSAELRDRFDTALATLRADGGYARIRERFEQE